MSTISQTLAQAQACQNAGRLDDAERLCRQLLHADPANAEAHNFLGILLAQQGKLDEAIDSLQQAVCIQPGAAGIANNLRHLIAAKENLRGQALIDEGKSDEAADCFRNALKEQPNSVAAHIQLGNLLRQQGQLEESAACFRAALVFQPHLVAAHDMLGVVLMDADRLDEAVACHRRALTLEPTNVEAHYNLGLALARQNQLDEAAASYRRAIELNPRFAEAHYNLGLVLIRQNKIEAAVDCFRQAIVLDSQSIRAHISLGNALVSQGQLDEAAACYRRILTLQGDCAEAHHNLGLVFTKQDRPQEAIACFRQAISLKPDYFDALNNLGVALMETNQLQESLDCYDRALKLPGDAAGAHYNRGFVLLLSGKLAEAWPEYEWRWQCKGKEKITFVQPQWTGEPLRGKTILLHCEQGLGDTLQFVRYAEGVRECGGRVIAVVQRPLVRLIQSCPGVDQVVARGDALPPFDVHAPIMSLPSIFRTTLDSIPINIPYLSPEEDLVSQWKDRLAGDARLKIGIAWQGSTGHGKDHLRSIRLTQFAGLAKIPGVQLYSVQMGAGREQLDALGSPPPIVDLSDRPGEMEHTAAILRNLDLVITCDSAPAHVAGALGVPVWVALPFAPDWRWMLDRQDSPWYPSMRLFRQSRPGDWDGVFQKIERAVAEIA